MASQDRWGGLGAGDQGEGEVRSGSEMERPVISSVCLAF